MHLSLQEGIRIGGDFLFPRYVRFEREVWKVRKVKMKVNLESEVCISGAGMGMDGIGSHGMR